MTTPIRPKQQPKRPRAEAGKSLQELSDLIRGAGTASDPRNRVAYAIPGSFIDRELTRGQRNLAPLSADSRAATNETDPLDLLTRGVSEIAATTTKKDVTQVASSFVESMVASVIPAAPEPSVQLVSDALVHRNEAYRGQNAWMRKRTLLPAGVILVHAPTGGSKTVVAASLALGALWSGIPSLYLPLNEPDRDNAEVFKERDMTGAFFLKNLWGRGGTDLLTMLGLGEAALKGRHLLSPLMGTGDQLASAASTALRMAFSKRYRPTRGVIAIDSITLSIKMHNTSSEAVTVPGRKTVVALTGRSIRSGEGGAMGQGMGSSDIEFITLMHLWARMNHVTILATLSDSLVPYAEALEGQCTGRITAEEGLSFLMRIRAAGVARRFAPYIISNRIAEQVMPALQYGAYEPNMSGSAQSTLG